VIFWKVGSCHVSFISENSPDGSYGDTGDLFPTNFGLLFIDNSISKIRFYALIRPKSNFKALKPDKFAFYLLKITSFDR
jgi:hypothetical protein